MPKITRQKLSETIVAALACPPGAEEAYFWDDDVKGLGLRIYQNGRRSWLFLYRNADGRRLRVTLKAADLRTARAAAGQHSRSVAVGGDPQVEAKARRKAETVLELIELYLPKAEARQSKRTHAEVKRALMVGAKPLHPLKAERVVRRDVVGVLNEVALRSGGVAANRVRAYLSAMWSWALRAGQVEGINPVANTPRPVQEAPRERVLTDDELALIWRCTAGGGDYHRAIRLLMLTAVRRDEVGKMMVTELDAADTAAATWQIAGSRTKNGLPHEVPLTPLAVDQLPTIKVGATSAFGQNGTGFSGWSKSKERLDGHLLAALIEDFTKAHGRAPEDGEVKLQPWRHHDLRRTFSTWANESGIEPHVVEAVLNHVSGGARRGVAGVYNKAQYKVQKRAALTAWERHLRAVCGLPGLGDNVHALRAAG